MFSFETFVSGAGFFTDAFDLFVINMVKNVLVVVYGGHAESWIVAMTSSALYAALVGMIVFGFLADHKLIGRRTTFLLTAGCTILGMAGSACCYDTDWFPIGLQLTVCRAIMGFGVGGEYPLSATVTAEAESQADSQGRRLSLVFSMQGLGNVFSSLVVYVLLVSGLPYDWVWRAAFLVGAVPMIVAFPFRWRLHSSEAFQQQAAVSHWRKLTAAYSVYSKYVLGTALSWFLLDVTFYGNGLFSATITKLLGLGSSSAKEALNALIVALMALPGYFLTVGLLDSVGRKPLQAIGFLCIAGLYFFIGLLYEHVRNIAGLFLTLYGLTFLFSNFGPNATTYIIPAEFYPTEVRASCHGLSAAAGKLGAALAATAFRPLLASIGVANLLLVCAGCGLLGFVVTVVFVPPAGVTEQCAYDYKVRMGEATSFTDSKHIQKI